MCTQHPDSTTRVTAAEEVDEAVIGHIAFGCDEVMVDYEGKATPYSQPRDIAARFISLGLPLGRRFFITPRIPSPRLEDLERSMLSLEASVLANGYSARVAGVHAVRWIVLPMVEDFETLMFVYKALDLKVRSLAELKAASRDEPVELVPLIEDAFAQLRVREFVEAVASASARSGRRAEHVRVFLGISDSAVRHGHIASSLAIVHALQQIDDINRNSEYTVWPILGSGSPPFRGGMNNSYLAAVEAEQYAGFHTVTLQSAVRYDISHAEFTKVREALARHGGPRRVEIKVEWIATASELYREFVKPYLAKIAELASLVPSTRERVSWTQYGRDIEGLRIPRAIVYTAAWYFAGLPPTLLDARFIAWAYKRDALDEVVKALPALIREWEYDSAYYCRKRVEKLLGGSAVREVEMAFDILGVKPEINEVYAALLSNAETHAHVIALGKVRGFLG